MLTIPIPQEHQGSQKATLGGGGLHVSPDLPPRIQAGIGLLSHGAGLWRIRTGPTPLFPAQAVPSKNCRQLLGAREDGQVTQEQRWHHSESLWSKLADVGLADLCSPLPGTEGPQ